jgi:hypothetical protein
VARFQTQIVAANGGPRCDRGQRAIKRSTGQPPQRSAVAAAAAVPHRADLNPSTRKDGADRRIPIALDERFAQAAVTAGMVTEKMGGA